MTPNDFSMTQPMCEPCFDAFVAGVVRPSKLVVKELEICCMCGNHNQDGIYVRLDPATVAFPTRLKN